MVFFWFDWNLEQKHVIKIWTEIKNIDVYIETDTHILLIENKIKSSEHSEQTTKYIEKLKIEIKKEIKWCFLTLIWEKAESKLEIWNNISYLYFYCIIKKFNIDNNYFNDYLQTLYNLTSSLNSFLGDHTKYLDIFKNWSLTKNDKLNEKFYKDKYEIFRYISKYQLETIFQKAFLYKLLFNIILEWNSFDIWETHGNANFNIYYKVMPEIDWKEYKLWLQLQNNTLKYTLSQSNYWKSESEDITDKMKENFKNKFDSKKLLRFNNPRTKAYISLSKQFEDYLYNKDFDKIVTVIKSEIKIFNEKCKNFLNTD